MDVMVDGVYRADPGFVKHCAHKRPNVATEEAGEVDEEDEREVGAGAGAGAVVAMILCTLFFVCVFLEE